MWSGILSRSAKPKIHKHSSWLPVFRPRLWSRDWCHSNSNCALSEPFIGYQSLKCWLDFYLTAGSVKDDHFLHLFGDRHSQDCMSKCYYLTAPGLTQKVVSRAICMIKYVAFIRVLTDQQVEIHLTTSKTLSQTHQPFVGMRATLRGTKNIQQKKDADELSDELKLCASDDGALKILWLNFYWQFLSASEELFRSVKNGCHHFPSPPLLCCFLSSDLKRAAWPSLVCALSRIFPPPRTLRPICRMSDLWRDTILISSPQSVGWLEPRAPCWATLWRLVGK